MVAVDYYPSQNIVDHSWRDRAGVDGPLMRAGWPDAAIERGDLWEDLVGLNSTFVFERAMVISRTGAHTRYATLLLLHNDQSNTAQSAVVVMVQDDLEHDERDRPRRLLEAPSATRYRECRRLPPRHGRKRRRRL